MPSRIAKSLIVFGSLVVFVAFCFVPAAFGETPDVDLREMGACLFSAGALFIATGLYFKSRFLQIAVETGNAPKAPAPSARTVRGGCDLCGGEAPVIHCKVHQLHLCGTCLTGHYDVRSCSYVPSTRTTANRSLLRSIVAGARG